jgi:ADP-ribose pyrophosphatase YjhB (NUDIX family)
VPSSPIPPGPIGDGDEVLVHASGQRWIATWHVPEAVPSGKPHGSAGICVTPEGCAVLISADGARWDLPAGRPEGAEDWEETLRREMLEEACAIVRTARLLGFSRGHCVRGHEEGLVLVRAFWRADVELQPWEPRFEIRHRRVVPVADLLSHLAAGGDGFLPVWRRAMIEAGLG